MPPTKTPALPARCRKCRQVGITLINSFPCSRVVTSSLDALRRLGLIFSFPCSCVGTSFLDAPRLLDGNVYCNLLSHHKSAERPQNVPKREHGKEKRSRCGACHSRKWRRFQFSLSGGDWDVAGMTMSRPSLTQRTNKNTFINPNILVSST